MQSTYFLSLLSNRKLNKKIQKIVETTSFFLKERRNALYGTHTQREKESGFLFLKLLFASLLFCVLLSCDVLYTSASNFPHFTTHSQLRERLSIVMGIRERRERWVLEEEDRQLSSVTSHQTNTASRARSPREFYYFYFFVFFFLNYKKIKGPREKKK